MSYKFPEFFFMFCFRFFSQLLFKLTIFNWFNFSLLRHNIIKQRHHFVNKGPYSQGYDLSHGHVWMRELDSKEGRVLKNWCFWTVVLEKTLESPLESKKIKPVNLKGNQPWIFIGRTDVKAEAPILWPPDVKNWLIGKDPDSGKDWRQEEKGTTEDEMVGWLHPFSRNNLDNSGKWWGTGKPGMLQSMGFWRVGHDMIWQLKNSNVIKQSVQCQGSEFNEYLGMVSVR